MVWTMDLKVENKTSQTLYSSNQAIYGGYGYVERASKNVDAGSKGEGGQLAKGGGASGLFGIFTYDCPDPEKKLVIYVEIPHATGTLCAAQVGLVSKNVPTDDKLAELAYGKCYGKDGDGSEGFYKGRSLNHTYKHAGQEYLLTVSAKVANPGGTNTYTDLTVESRQKA